MKIFITTIVLLTILLMGTYHLGKWISNLLEDAEDIIENNY
jgi:hypothetical protein